ncbi:MAG: hypothetical protein NC084_12200 [Bacteroides sp.]|nr:hypothetical protein [Eubacterium sp.]MCM1419525.1 hypothetical protein [Roseburia sp.]MCM1463455.1 hypothetical protein [Bacteroides sp.]
MAEEYVTRSICDERCRRLEEEDKRQNRRIELLEESTREIRSLAASVERLAMNMESMLKGQEKQDARLEALEGRDGEKWRKAIGYIGTAIIGGALAIIAAKLGLG